MFTPFLLPLCTLRITFYWILNKNHSHEKKALQETLQLPCLGVFAWGCKQSQICCFLQGFEELTQKAAQGLKLVWDVTI